MPDNLVSHPSFSDAVSACSTLVFTYAGTPAFFNIVSEMRDPQMYTRSLTICQVTVTVVYIIVGTIMYYFCGSYVASPAIGSAGPLLKKVGYGIALPGLLGSAILLGHVRIPSTDLMTVTLTLVAPCQAYLYPTPSRNRASNCQHNHSLDHMDRFNGYCIDRRLCYRQWYPCLWRPRFPHWCPLRHIPLTSTHGLHVAVRPLERRA